MRMEDDNDLNREIVGTASSARLGSVQETLQKVESALSDSIDAAEDFSPDDGLDFLQAKNSLLFTYLIDSVVRLRNNKNQPEQSTNQDDSCVVHRLRVTTTALEKMRGLEKKLKYMVDKILSASTDASTFASATDDPLQYRPSSGTSSSGIHDESSSTTSNTSYQKEDDDDPESTTNTDDDLAAAQLTVRAARKQTDDSDHPASVYRAPRTVAVPYALEKAHKQAEQEKRERRKLRTSELARTLRSQYGDAPDQDDLHGGSEMGKQREAARRFAEKQQEKTNYEEEMFVRLQPTRKDKKERKRIMRQEESNLAAIADLGNITRDSRLFVDSRTRQEEQGVIPDFDGRHANGKRKKVKIDRDGRPLETKKKKSVQAKNSLQAELFGKSSRKKKK